MTPRVRSMTETTCRRENFFPHSQPNAIVVTLPPRTQDDMHRHRDIEAQREVVGHADAGVQKHERYPSPDRDPSPSEEQRRTCCGREILVPSNRGHDDELHQCDQEAWDLGSAFVRCGSWKRRSAPESGSGLDLRISYGRMIERRVGWMDGLT